MHESATAFVKGPQAGTPTVSVGIPVYNGAKFLASALDSLLSQTFTDIEIIISDNASTDLTPEICRRYASRDGRIRYVRQKHNQGAAWNFCEVYKLSVGRYFKWAAADDICSPTYIERCVDVLDRDPTVVCCHSRTRKIDRDGNPLEHLPDPTIVMSRFPKRCMNGSSRYTARRYLDVLLTSGWGARCFGVIRSEALRNSQLILPTFGSEKVLMAELSLIGRYHDLPETLWYQRVHGDASSLLRTAAARGKFIAGYVIRMSKDQLPPAKAFWSVTLYDTQNGFFIPNERKKYSVGENAGMKLNKDGGIDIYIAASKPEGVPEENWLPIERKDEGIDAVLRVYIPDMEKMKTWQKPKAQMLK